ncbi:MAG: T9SS type A sorting domain-containing protein [Bacteroidaceae bacterium]|nr:T9SS type A sorting domain-containing protein [Bacteroidaceae bacterium]
MKTKVLFAIIAMLGTLPCFASKALVLLLTDSTKVVCSLTKEPKMVFGDKTLTLTSIDGAVGEWNFTDVASWSFAEVQDVDDAIKEIKSDRIEINGNRLMVSGTKPITVYDLSGRERTPKLTTKDDCTSVDLSGFTKGTYLLKVGKNTMKFMVK